MEKDKLLKLIEEQDDIFEFFNKIILVENTKNFDEEIKYELVKQVYLELDDRVKEMVEYNREPMPHWVPLLGWNGSFSKLQEQLLQIVTIEEFFDYCKKAFEEKHANIEFEENTDYTEDIISLGFDKYISDEIKEHPRYTELTEYIDNTIKTNKTNTIRKMIESNSFEELTEYLSSYPSQFKLLPEEFKTKENMMFLIKKYPSHINKIYSNISDELKNDNDILNLIFEMADTIKSYNIFDNEFYSQLSPNTKTKDFLLKHPILLDASLDNGETIVLNNKELLNAYLQYQGINNKLLSNIKGLLKEHREIVEPYFIKFLQEKNKSKNNYIKQLDLELEDFATYSRIVPEILNYMPAELKKDLDNQVDNLDIRNELVFSSLSEEYRADFTNALKAFIANPRNIYHIDKKLLEDPKFAINIVSINGKSIESLPLSFQRNKKLMLLAVKQDGNALNYLSSHLAYDTDIIIQAVTSSPELDIPKRIKRSDKFPDEKVQTARHNARLQQAKRQMAVSRTDEIIIKEDADGNKVSFLDGLLHEYTKKENNLFNCDLETLKTKLKNGEWKETNTERNISIKYYIKSTILVCR